MFASASSAWGGGREADGGVMTEAKELGPSGPAGHLPTLARREGKRK